MPEKSDRRARAMRVHRAPAPIAKVRGCIATRRFNARKMPIRRSLSLPSFFGAGAALAAPFALRAQSPTPAPRPQPVRISVTLPVAARAPADESSAARNCD